ncbi:hypothetical protein QCA50_009104 [Cerrena zonata]|uniref:Uncharacterized protein n=1 Tax=Cerrena zonata TaxID=2478898 RepID=A0AAW0G312_9APHY
MNTWIPNIIRYRAPDERDSYTEIDPYYARSEEILTDYLKETYGERIENPKQEAENLRKRIMISNGDRIAKVGWPQRDTTMT